MQEGDTCTIQDIPGFLEVKLKVKYLESCENCKIWLNRQGFLIGGLTPLAYQLPVRLRFAFYMRSQINNNKKYQDR